MASETSLALLGALVGTQNLTYDDSRKIESFMDFVDEVNVDIPDIHAAIDLALDFYNDDPDVEAEAFQEKVRTAHEMAEHGDVCPDCGGPMSEPLDDADIEQAIDLWYAVRGIADKYAFDRRDFSGGGSRDIEEC